MLLCKAMSSSSFILFIERLARYHIGWLALLWLAICTLFASVYATISSLAPAHGLTPFASGNMSFTDTFLDSLYFSMNTALTIGYGDVTPLGISKGIAAMQSILAWFFFAILLMKLIQFQYSRPR